MSKKENTCFIRPKNCLLEVSRLNLTWIQNSVFYERFFFFFCYFLIQIGLVWSLDNSCWMWICCYIPDSGHAWSLRQVNWNNVMTLYRSKISDSRKSAGLCWDSLYQLESVTYNVTVFYYNFNWIGQNDSQFNVYTRMWKVTANRCTTIHPYIFEKLK